MDTPSRKAGKDPDPHGDRQRLDDLDKRLKEARGTVEEPPQSSGMSHRQTAVAYRVLVDMIAGLLLGGFVGYWLDRWLGWAPWGLLVLLVVGFIGGANNAWRTIRSFSADAAAGEDKDRQLP